MSAKYTSSFCLIFLCCPFMLAACGETAATTPQATPAKSNATAATLVPTKMPLDD